MIGASSARPTARSVCVTGDGAAGFNIMELQTAAREGVDITVIVFAEGSWTMEELNERQLYGTTFGTAQGEIRWDLVAQGWVAAASMWTASTTSTARCSAAANTAARAWSACAPTTTPTSPSPPR